MYAPDSRVRCDKCGFYLFPDFDGKAVITKMDGRKFTFHYPSCYESLQLTKSIRSIDITLEKKK